MSLDFQNIFTYHAPEGDQVERYGRLRLSGRTLAESIDEMCPDSREKSLAITKVREAISWANASIAINENHSHVLSDTVRLEGGGYQPNSQGEKGQPPAGAETGETSPKEMT